MTDLRRQLSDANAAVFASLDLPLDHARVTVSDRPDLADFQSNGALAVSKIAKLPPREVATRIMQGLSGHALIGGIDIAGPGFINLQLRDAARQCMALAERGTASTADERTYIRVQIATLMEHCRQAIRTVCEASGSSAHALDNPLQRALRDINVMASHVVYDLDMALELRGRTLVGLPPNTALT